MQMIPQLLSYIELKQTNEIPSVSQWFIGNKFSLHLDKIES